MKRFLQIMSTSGKYKSTVSQRLSVLSKLYDLSGIYHNTDIDKGLDVIEKTILTDCLKKAKNLQSNKEWLALVKYCKHFLKDINKFELGLSQNEKKLMSEIYTLLGKGLCHGTHNDAIEAKECFEKALSLDRNNLLAIDEKFILSVELGETPAHSIPDEIHKDEAPQKKL